MVFSILSFVEPLVHEDQDGELVGKLLKQKKDRMMISDWQTLHLRGDVDELEALHGLVDADHREGAEDLHHRRALACDVDPEYDDVRKGLGKSF